MDPRRQPRSTAAVFAAGLVCPGEPFLSLLLRGQHDRAEIVFPDQSYARKARDVFHHLAAGVEVMKFHGNRRRVHRRDRCRCAPFQQPVPSGKHSEKRLVVFEGESGDDDHFDEKRQQGSRRGPIRWIRENDVVGPGDEFFRPLQVLGGGQRIMVAAPVVLEPGFQLQISQVQRLDLSVVSLCAYDVFFDKSVAKTRFSRMGLDDQYFFMYAATYHLVARGYSAAWDCPAARCHGRRPLSAP
jgi:hypothetical protein